MTPRVGIVAEGSYQWGAGHQVRMSVLAWEMHHAGWHYVLLARDLPGSAHRWAWSGLQTCIYPAHSQLTTVLLAQDWDILLIDHYHFSAAELQQLAAKFCLVHMDDVPGRDLSMVATVINQNPGVEPRAYVVSALTGHHYALVRSAFRNRHWLHRSRAHKEALLLMGATDPRSFGRRLLPLLMRRYPDWIWHWVSARRLPAQPRLQQHRNLSAADMAALMCNCDCTLTACGSTVYELAAVGAPFVAIQTAANQARNAAGLQQLGWASVKQPWQWRHALAFIATQPWRQPSRCFIDGLGSQRICAELKTLWHTASYRARE